MVVALTTRSDPVHPAACDSMLMQPVHESATPDTHTVTGCLWTLQEAASARKFPRPGGREDAGSVW